MGKFEYNILIMVRAICLFISCLYIACTPSSKEEENLPSIVCTTGMIGDVVYNLVGENVKLHTLMGPGVDPHLYKATLGDLKKLSDADIIFYNGLHLEGKMAEVFEKLGKRKNVKAVAEGVDSKNLLYSPDIPNVYDPHIWFDVDIWIQVTTYIQNELNAAFPELKNTISENTPKYIFRLENVRDTIKTQILQIPERRRILVTSHDAFRYFGKAFGIKVKGLQGISTISGFGLRDINNMVDLVIDKQIKSIFVETSISQKSIKAIIKGCKSRGIDIKLGGSLFSDAMGSKGTPEGTYIGMLQYNTHKIVEGLK